MLILLNWLFKVFATATTDSLAFSGHKGIMGPLGTGGLYVSPEVELSPVITGGTGSDSKSLVQPGFMPDMLHSGTMNTPAIVALGTAIECIMNYTDEIFMYERALAKNFISDLGKFPSNQVL